MESFNPMLAQTLSNLIRTGWLTKAGLPTRSLRGLGDACGGPLLVFRTSRGPFRLTALGRRLLVQAGQASR